jgi:hypothetical protein
MAPEAENRYRTDARILPLVPELSISLCSIPRITNDGA